MRDHIHGAQRLGVTLSFSVRVGYSVIKDSISRDFMDEDVEQVEQDDERLRRLETD